MNPAPLLPLLVAVPLLGAALLVAAGRRLPRVVCETVGCAVAAATAALAVAALSALGPERSYAVEWLGGWRPDAQGRGVGIALTGDPAGLGLAALVSVLVVAVLVYAWRYFGEPQARQRGSFPALVLVFQAGMCGFCLTGDLFNLFVCYELMGVVAYALTGYRVEERRPLQGALAFGVTGSLGGYAMLLGITLLYARTGELGLAQLGRALEHHDSDPLVLAAFVLLLTGLLTKAAAVPFHFWLPDAHAVAPSPVCLLLSGVMVELGVYGTARVYWTVFATAGGVPHEVAQRTLLTVGVVTALLGAAMCWQQRHLKRLLAFSTIGHTGLFLTGIAVLSPEGAAGTALYVLGHAGVKAALFACTGVLLDRSGSVDEHELHGRGRGMPVTGVLFTLGGLGLCGLPPFGSALGKAVAEEAAGQYAHWLTGLFVLVSAVTGGAVLRAAARIFRGMGPRPYESGGAAREETTGDEDPETAEHERLGAAPATMLAVPAALLALTLAAGLVPRLAEGAGRAGRLLAGHHAYAAAVLDGATAPAVHAVPASWTLSGVLLGLLSTALACGIAALGVRSPRPGRLAAAMHPVRRLQSGHIGDYVAWLIAGAALLGLLAAYGTAVP
ncbi:complex I subunit 5 family protein [Streptomyces sp. ODS28]|uniref:complex I subunit 5 family protein n=1 Tax=Streptomyces sp. ODS28 TaxID=3136688 RepID=UPI0031EF869F